MGRLGIILTLCMLTQPSLAVETGRKAAMKYFIPSAKSTSPAPASSSSSSRSYDKLFSVSAGTFINSQSFKWTDSDIGGWSFQLEYRKSSVGDFFAKAFQLELQKFEVGREELTKISGLLSLVFPKSISFPVYIGIAGGPGFFIQQTEKESFLTLDYKGFLGLRLNQTHSQFFLESGVKNHVHVLSDGQFIGWFVSSGVSYKF